MKQVVDAFGVPIHGLFRREDGSLIFDSPEQLEKSKVSAQAFAQLNSEVETLKKQMKLILEHIHG